MQMLDLFSGIGGISLAADWAGIKTAAFCEIDPFCQKILSKHWPRVPTLGDIKTINKQTLSDLGVDQIDIIAGGFPCQPWSEAAGDKAKGRDDERHLWPEMFRLIHEIQPTWVVGENVANFARMGLDDTLTDLEGIGYQTQSFIIPACAVQAPHERKRTFIVAYADRKRNYIAEEHGTNGNGKEKMQQRKHAQLKLTDKVKAPIPRERWRNEPGMGRMVNGLSDRVERCKALGNAVVPQQIYPILAAIKKIDDMMRVG